jgi:NAD(P)-dependent dehydrogenase (short-subunit alcohol dehydrogenase family)
MRSQGAERVAVVTGAGRGLGRAFALALSNAGYAIALIARSERELRETARQVERGGGRALVVPADITFSATVADAFTHVEHELGDVDLLVNNAGLLGPLGPFVESYVEDWWRTFDTNLRAQALCAHRVLPSMIARKHGRIVNIASGAGARVLPYYSAYVTSKTALIRFSECLAAEVKPHGVSVFAMGPGTVRTAMTEHSLHSDEGKTWLPWFRRIFDEGEDLPPERPAALLLALASGEWDSLSGLYLDPFDDLDRIAEHISKVRSNELYSLSIRRLAHRT